MCVARSPRGARALTLAVRRQRRTARQELTEDEIQEILVDHVCICSAHPVRVSRIDLERAILEELGLKQCGCRHHQFLAKPSTWGQSVQCPRNARKLVIAFWKLRVSHRVRK